MDENFKEKTGLTLGDAVSPDTARKMKKEGFSQPEKAYGQIWQTAKGHIIANNHFDSKGALEADILFKNLEFLENESEFSKGIPDMLNTFLPNADDILHSLNEKVDEWANVGPDNEGNFKCYLIDSPELKFEDRSRHEACARAWLFVHQPKG